MNFLIRLLITAAVAFGLARFLPGVTIADFTTAIIFALVLALLNLIVKPILFILTLPATILTLGLFLFVLNAIVVLLASKFVNGIAIANIWWAILFAFLLSFITSIIMQAVGKDD